MTTALEKKPPELPEPVARRGIDEAQWRTFKNVFFPGISTESILMYVDYCAARKLDPMKRPAHIVAVEMKNGQMREVVMMGISELRITAQRTGEYLAHSVPDYGPIVDFKGLKVPEWCAMTMYRLHPATGRTLEFPVKTYFREVVATTKDGKPNARWSRAPVQMMTKCCEAAGLREAFPGELGGEHTEEELEGQRPIDAPIATTIPSDLVKPDRFDDWLLDLAAVADEGSQPFEATWADSSRALRAYLMATDPERYEQLKAKAAGKDAPE